MAALKMAQVSQEWLAWPHAAVHGCALKGTGWTGAPNELGALLTCRCVCVQRLQTRGDMLDSAFTHTGPCLHVPCSLEEIANIETLGHVQSLYPPIMLGEMLGPSKKCLIVTPCIPIFIGLFCVLEPRATDGGAVFGAGDPGLWGVVCPF
jgi:hypothetical protein